MLTTEQVLKRLEELSSDKKLLSQFNKTNGTDITDITIDKTDSYCVIDIGTKQFVFDMELFDETTDGHCCYNLQLRETAWRYDFDDCVDIEDIRYMYQLEGELGDGYNDVDLALCDMLPRKEDCNELVIRIKKLLKFKKILEDNVEEYEGNQYFITTMVKNVVDVW